MKIVITVNSAWNLVNFRAGLIRALVDAGHQVYALAPADPYVKRVRALGCQFIDLPMNNRGKNPIEDIMLFFRYVRQFRKIKPDVVLSFTIKPNIYGALAAKSMNAAVISNVAGLGTTFLRRGTLNSIVRILYRFALNGSHKVFFQNADDLALFLDGGLVRQSQTDLIPGSGVNVVDYAPRPPVKTQSKRTKFLLVARLLWEKGVAEYIEAIRLLRVKGLDIDGRLLGFVDVQNPSAITKDEVTRWHEAGAVTYLGQTDDVRDHIAEVDCIVLPSYYPEGTPRSLLEAASMGKPIITTNMPGCRNAVIDQKSGYLIPPRNAQALADAMGKIAELSVTARDDMGAKGRQLILQKYDERIVIKFYLDALAGINSLVT